METEIVLEGSIATWTMLPLQGDLGGTYLGSFKFRCFLNPLQQLQAGREYRELLGSNPAFASDTELQLAFAISQLKQRVIKAPPFWTSSAQEAGVVGNIGDLNIIGAVLDAAMLAEEMYKKKIKEERDKILDKAIKAGEELSSKDK